MAQLAGNENPLKGKLVRQLDLNSPAKDVYSIYRSQCKLFPRIMPQQIRNVELLKGDWDKEGSERLWTFVDASCQSWKDIVEAINDQEMSITWTLIQGVVPTSLYRSLKVEHQFSKENESPKATVILTYEKTKATVPVPVVYMDFILGMLAAVVNADLLKLCEKI